MVYDRYKSRGDIKIRRTHQNVSLSVLYLNCLISVYHRTTNKVSNIRTIYLRKKKKSHTPGSNVAFIIAIGPTAEKHFRTAATLLLYTSRKYYFNKSCIFFLRNCIHPQFQAPKVSDSNIGPVSPCRATAMLILLFVGNKRLGRVGVLEWTNVHTKFRLKKNQRNISNLEIWRIHKHTHTHTKQTRGRIIMAFDINTP